MDGFWPANGPKVLAPGSPAAPAAARDSTAAFWQSPLLAGAILGGAFLSERARRTKIVFDAVAALREAGKAEFEPGDVTGRLRDDGVPFGAWEVRGELANLERLGLVVLDESTARWRLVNGADFSIDTANAVYAGASSDGG